MTCNVGLVDRVIRVLIGAALIYCVLNGVIGIWGWLGIVLVVTGAFSWCPLYSIIGLRTCAPKSEDN